MACIVASLGCEFAILFLCVYVPLSPLLSDPSAPSTLMAGVAVNRLVEDAAQCKFESTNDTSDEVVLLNIVQVSVRVCAGALLNVLHVKGHVGLPVLQ